MGIRLHKTLGYGFVASPEIFDKKITSIVELKRYESSVSEYKEFLLRKYPDSTTLEAQLSDLAHFNTTFQGKEDYTGANFVSFCYELSDGQAAVVIIPALAVDDWRQDESPMDYAEHAYARQKKPSLPAMENTVKVLTEGPFPFDGSWMDKATGKHMKNYDPTLFTYLQEKDVKGNLSRMDRERFLAIYSATSFQRARGKIIPEVPQSVKDVAEWLQIFTDVNDWKLLRPTILTEWS